MFKSFLVKFTFLILPLMISRLAKSFIDTNTKTSLFKGLLQAHKNYKKMAEKEFNKFQKDLKQFFNYYNKNNPNHKFGAAAFMVAIYIMYEMKREEG